MGVRRIRKTLAFSMIFGVFLLGGLCDPDPPENPCARVRCAQGFHCIDLDGQAECVADQADVECFIGGCSRQVCSNRPDVVTTCEWRAEYACYRDAECAVQANGTCGWSETPELESCLRDPPGFGQGSPDMELPRGSDIDREHDIPLDEAEVPTTEAF